VRENVSADQIVLREILGALGLHLAMNGPGGGEFIYLEPGYTALVNAVAPGGWLIRGKCRGARRHRRTTALSAYRRAATSRRRIPGHRCLGTSAYGTKRNCRGAHGISGAEGTRPHRQPGDDSHPWSQSHRAPI
jgi:hypothetical protein